MKKRQHIESDTLLLYVLNELSKDERMTVNSHCKTCRDCHQQLEKEFQLQHIIQNQPRFIPDDATLTRNRNILHHHIQKVTAESKRFRWMPRFNNDHVFWIPIRRLAPAACIFILGIALGRFWSRAESMREQDAQTALSTLISATPVSALRVLPETGQKDEIEIRFRAPEEMRLTGKREDPDIQSALAYAFVNEPRDNVRLQTIALLDTVSQNQTVQNALIRSLETDGNPGIRLKAIKILKSLPMNEKIKKILIFSLFQDPNSGVRVEAAKALHRLPDPDIPAILAERAKDDAYARALLAKTLGKNALSVSRKQ